MPLKRDTYYDIYVKFRDKLMATTNITQLVQGAKARSFLELVASEFGNVYDNVLYDVSQGILRFANGDMLDEFGAMYGVRRKQSGQASANAEEKVIKLSAPVGETFGTINSGSNILIPHDTVIKSNADSAIEYRVYGSFALSSSESERYISAVSINSGTVGNVPKGYLDVLSFSSYTGAATTPMSITNEFSIGNGTDVESDTNYRYRISLRLQELERCNIYCLYSSLLGLSGVRDIRFKRFADGIGTTRVYMYGLYPDQSPQLVRLGQQVVDMNAAAGEYVQVVSPDIIEIGMKFSLTFGTTKASGLSPEKATSASQKSTAKEAVSAALIDYFDSLPIEAPLVPEKLISVIMSADNNIVDIGTSTTTFDYITLTRTLPNGRKVSRYLTSNYTPRVGELITLTSVDITYE